jgi:hypothetical protein
MKFKKIHACKNECILFHVENAGKEEQTRVMTTRRHAIKFLGWFVGTSP